MKTPKKGDRCRHKVTGKTYRVKWIVGSTIVLETEDGLEHMLMGKEALKRNCPPLHI